MHDPLMTLVGASGFEPPTSWSYTKRHGIVPEEVGHGVRVEVGRHAHRASRRHDASLARRRESPPGGQPDLTRAA